MSPTTNPPTANQPNTQTAKETNTADPDPDPDPDSTSNSPSNSLFSPSQGPALTAIIDTVLVLVLIIFLTVCFLQWRSGNRVLRRRRRRRQKRRREDQERDMECRDHHGEYDGYGYENGYGYAGPSYLGEVPPLEEEDLRSGVERAEYHHRNADGDGGVHGDGGRLVDGNDTCTAETGSSLGGGVERCERGRQGDGNGNGHEDGDVKGAYRFEEVRVGR
ncbi:hypothetical protein QBC32DRAFT_384462 [Pseudoneurospora amorphoporcata]|uniref:Uncharacterized protein n=1 Tax=Pseudoneurospora amorphoporcata TaxID=241081 RepID=A0AAN6SID8_9PEZI|nr:hypothetical protein QBC32DRAFT_384462 [Pseudoneurospora amorphoporcata]